MTRVISKESTSDEGTEDKKEKEFKYATATSRCRTLKNLMKATNDIKDATFKFFDEDLHTSRIPLAEGEDCHDQINVYEMLLIMLQNIPDRKKPAGKLLTRQFLDIFVDWMGYRNVEEELKREQLTDDVIQKAKRNCARDTEFMESLQQIFNVSNEEIKEKRDEMISGFMEKQQYKEASDLILKHDLTHKFSFDELVLPLILADKCQIVDELLKQNKRFQRDYIEFLDYFVGETDEYVDKYFDSYKDKGMVKINLNRFYGRSLTTFITKFFNERVKQFNFDLEERRDAPRYEAFMKGKALKYYCMQRFGDGVMADEVYFEHAKNTLQQSSNQVVSYYLSLLWDSGYQERRVEVLFWMEYLENAKESLQSHHEIQSFLKYPDPVLVSEVKKLMDIRLSAPGSEITEQLFVFEEQQKYPITIVKNNDQLEMLCCELNEVEYGVYVGYDSEFKPFHLVDSNASKMAIIQLFFNQRAFLIDCVELENQRLPDKSWKMFFECLFGSKKFKVTAFDIKNDMEVLFTMPALRNYKMEDIHNCICVKKFAEVVNDIDPEILKLDKKTSKLKNLVDQLVGWKMDKTEQQGNWLARPLRKNQIVYAALDAVAVLELFLTLLQKTKDFEPAPDVEKILAVSHMAITGKKERVKKETKLLSSMQWSEIYEILHTHRDPTKPLQKLPDLKIIADTMVLGAGKNLRLLGADVLLPRDANSFQSTIKEIKKLNAEEQRYIITVPSRSHDTLKAENPNLKFIIFQDVYHKQPIDLICDFFDFFNLDIHPDGELLLSKNSQ